MVDFGWIVMLPRCQNLQYVDLTQVSASNPKFSGLKKTISELHELKALALPRKLKLTINNNPASEWPPQLRQLSLAIGDLLDARVFQEFEWPPSLTGFTVNWSSDLCEESLELALCSQEGFRTSLWSLHIHWRIPDFFFNFDTTDLLYRLPNLVLLRTSVTLINWTWMDTPPPGRTSLPLRILELTGGWPWPDDEGMRDAMKYLEPEVEAELRARLEKAVENDSVGGGPRGIYETYESGPLFTEDVLE